MKTCILCGETRFTKLIHYERAPKDIQGLLREEDLARDRTIKLDLVQCDACELAQLGEIGNLSEEYYDEYVMAQTFSPHSRAYSKRLAQDFAREFKLAGKELLEIGCGDGEFLMYLKEEGAVTLGVEPSAPFAKMAREKGLEVRLEYFDDTTPLKPDSFDAVASRAVFEHLQDPNQILRNLKKVMREGAVGMIEVPSFEKAIKDRRYYDVFSDHIAYYTKRTMMTLLERAGFEIVKAFNEFEDEYIVVYFRKNTAYDLSRFVSEFQPYKATFKETVADLRGQGKRIVVWGAGAKGNAILNMCDVARDDVEYVVDSDPHKIGKYTIGNHFPIRHPDTLQEETPDVIIISAMAFHDEIMQTIEGKYRFKGEVYVISPRLRKVR